MYELGKKNEFIGAHLLKPLDLFKGYRPTKLPQFSEGEIIVCGVNNGSSENLFTCATIEEVQEMWDECHHGLIFEISWYSGDHAVLLGHTYNL